MTRWNNDDHTTAAPFQRRDVISQATPTAASLSCRHFLDDLQAWAAIQGAGAGGVERCTASPYSTCA